MRKGWSTDDETVSMKVEAWKYKRIVPVDLAIDFHETGEDTAEDLGKEAEFASPDPIINFFIGMLILLLAAFATYLLY